MTIVVDPQAFRERMERLETLLHEVDGLPDGAMRARTREIVQAMLDLHGAGLARLLEQLAEAREIGPGLLRTLAEDDLVSGMLLLHGLHPLDVETRVRQALDRVRPQLRKQGGDVELLSVSGEVARVRMHSNGHGHGSAGTTLRQAVEGAIYDRAPEVTAVEVEGLAERPTTLATTFVPLEQLVVSFVENQRKGNSHETATGPHASQAGPRAGHGQR